MLDLKIKGDLNDVLCIDVDFFKEICDTYKGDNNFIKDVITRVEKYQTASTKQITAIVKCFKSDEEYAKKNKERLARIVPMDEGKGEVIGEVISIKEYDNKYAPGPNGGHIYKMLIDDFKGYRVFGSVPQFFLDEDIKVGDFVKFNAKLRQKELGFGFFAYPRKAVFVDGESAKIAREDLKPKIETSNTAKKAKLERELMDFLSA
jgi:hypothetical protein